MASLADPPAQSVLTPAAAWIEGLLLGTVGTTIAIIAVASIGFMMLGGRLRLRHGMTVIAGCFLLFGASGIVAGLRASLAGTTTSEVAAAPPPPSPLENVAANADPYAGASVPIR